MDAVRSAREDAFNVDGFTPALDGHLREGRNLAGRVHAFQRLARDGMAVARALRLGPGSRLGGRWYRSRHAGRPRGTAARAASAVLGLARLRGLSCGSLPWRTDPERGWGRQALFAGVAPGSDRLGLAGAALAVTVAV